jgi:Vacuolar protein sorting-associated protein 62
MRGELASATVYVHIRPACVRKRTTANNQPKNLEIQYWFFYPYNGAIAGSGAHEGDWEHITIQFNGVAALTDKGDIAAPKTKGDIAQIFFSRHTETVWIANEKDKIEFEGNRPVIFSARHTHANYSTPYEGPIDKAHRGERWETWVGFKPLELLEDNPAAEVEERGFVRHPWNRFNGNWGGSKSMVSTPGIRGMHGWDAD